MTTQLDDIQKVLLDHEPSYAEFYWDIALDQCRCGWQPTKIDPYAEWVEHVNEKIGAIL